MASAPRPPGASSARSLEASAGRRRVLAVLALAVVPWTVVSVDGGSSYVFSFGLVTFDPFHLVDVYDYLFVHTDGLPRRLQAWPAGLLLYLGALASAVAGLVDREDPRLTAGLLVVAGVAHLQVALGLHRTYAASGSALVLPVGAVLTWLVVWWCYWPLVHERGIVPGG